MLLNLALITKKGQLIKVCVGDVLILRFSGFPLLQQSDDNVLKFESLVLLHDMVSQVTSHYSTFQLFKPADPVDLFFFFTVFCVFTGNPSLEAALHLVSCRGRYSAGDDAAATLSRV